MRTNSNGYLSYSCAIGEQPHEDKGKGRIANALTKQIAYARTPELFDTKEIQDRDKQLIQEIRETDIKLCIDRKDKPVFLTPIQQRIVFALSYGLSQDIDIKEIQDKIADPFKTGQSIARNINITSLSYFLFGKAEKRFKLQIIKELFYIGKIRQAQEFTIKKQDRHGNIIDAPVRLTSPLINVGTALEDLSPEKANDLDVMQVTFGAGFFVGLDKRFSVITPKMFEVWRKKGRGTELYSVLLNNLLSVYWQFKTAAQKAEERVKSDKEYKNLNAQEREQRKDEARKKAMTFELNASRIKERVGRDYESNRANKAAFWKDLENAIDGFKELGLIVDAYTSKGAKGQEKVTFVFSETYNFYDKEEETKAPLLLEQSTNDDSEPSPF